ncbi:MAG: Crp/Fnr family transcriptional regulator [Elainellaceae cyanobacterium]
MNQLSIQPSEILANSRLPIYLKEAIATVNLAPGQALYHQGDPVSAIYRVESGRIRLIRHTVEGRVVTFRVIRAGEIFAETDLYSDIYQCDAISDVASQISVYPKNLIFRAMQDDGMLAQDLIRQLNQIIRSLKFRLELLAIRSASDRILEYFRFSTSPSEPMIRFDRPLKDIASDLGLSPEVFYRTLARLEKDGIIARNKRQITLLK